MRCSTHSEQGEQSRDREGAMRFHTVIAYDGKMRRRIVRDYSWNTGTSDWQETNEVHFIYDGNVVVEERNANNVPLVSYTRGPDLSGTLEGAGGIGGILARTTYGQELLGAPTTAFYHVDGNGNVTALMYPNQQLAAKYLYDPFGNMLAMSGPLMNFNKYRFSSKEWNDNSGLYYYLYRFYNPSLQRWLNRDPSDEGSGLNLYQYVASDPLNAFDPSGLTIEYANHPVLGKWFHSFLIIIPDDQCMWEKSPLFVHVNAQGKHYMTIGAGPIPESGALIGTAKLIAQFDRTDDVKKTPQHIRALPLPGIYYNEDEAIAYLMSLTWVYDQDPERYTAFPNNGWYNSNSFISGLIQAAGYDWFSDTGADTPGWLYPVPSSDFEF
jgi:RHS repeat-associated protein